MNLFYFGSSEKPLLGVHHPPQVAGGPARGAVLCNPVGQEYMRAHRALRLLASELTRRGFHVLRFDYFATGDSGGDSEEGTLAQWSADVATAVEELEENANLASVSLVGLRLGAALASLAAERRDDVERLVLWDPVVRGADYRRELFGGAPAPEGGFVLGFPWSAALCRELEALDLTRREPPRARSVEIVVSEERPEFGVLRDDWRGRGGAVGYTPVPSPGDWNEVDQEGSVWIPRPLIREIAKRLAPDGA